MNAWQQQQQQNNSAWLSTILSSWFLPRNHQFHPQRLKNHLYRILIDDSLLILLSSWANRCAIQPFLSQVLACLQKQWRQDSFEFLKRTNRTKIQQQQENNSTRLATTTLFRHKRTQLNQLVQTGTLLNEYHSLIYSNDSSSYRFLYTLLSIGLTSLLEWTQMDSLGSLFAFIKSGRLLKQQQQQQQHSEGYPTTRRVDQLSYFAKCTLSLLKAIISFHLYDTIMYLVRNVLRGWILSRSTTRREKWLESFMSPDNVKQLIQYDFDCGRSTRSSGIGSDGNGTDVLTFFSQFISFISDLLSDSLNHVSEALNISNEFLSDEMKEGEELQLQQEEEEEKQRKSNSNQTSEANDLQSIRDSMKKVFKTCIQTMELLNEGLQSSSNPDYTLQLIQEKACVQLYTQVDTIRRQSLQLLAHIDLKTGRSTTSQIVQQMVQSMSRSIRLSRSKHVNTTKPKGETNSKEQALRSSLAKSIDELDEYCRFNELQQMIQIMHKSNSSHMEDFTIMGSSPASADYLLRSEYNFDSLVIPMLQLPIRLVSVLLADMLASSFLQIDYVNS